MKLSLKLIPFILLMSVGKIFSHALWIETPFSGKIGIKQDIKIYYGEYAENERDSLSKWFSDVKDVKLWLIGPDDKKIELTTSQNSDHLSSSFTPTLNGIYTITAQHAASKVPGDTRYEFISSASVTVGKQAQTKESEGNGTNLSLNIPAGAAFTTSTSALVKALFKNQSSKDITFSVVAPTGWAKYFTADANGNLAFTPIWPGTYFIEAFHTSPEAGEVNGKAYTSVWRGATYRINVDGK